MPVLSERDDVIVITDEAHRSQYDTLAAEHAQRAAERRVHRLHRHAADRRRGADPRGLRRLRQRLQLPRSRSRTARPSRSTTRTASPSCSSSTRTSTTSWTRCSRRPSSTRTQEEQLEREFGREYHLITRDERLETIAEDLVAHFVGRGFRGKAMFVAIDKATAVRMYDKVAERVGGASGRAARRSYDALPELERAGLGEPHRAAWTTTDMAVVVSPVPERDRRPAAARASTSARTASGCTKEDLDEQVQGPRRPAAARVRLRDVDDRLRRADLLDDLPRQADAEPHADADHRPRQPGVPGQGQRPDRRLRRRVPRTSQKALAIYGSRARRAGEVDTPIQDKAALVEPARGDRRGARVLQAHEVDLDSDRWRPGLRVHRAVGAAVERARQQRRGEAPLPRAARARSRKLFKAVLPDPRRRRVRAGLRRARRTSPRRFARCSRPPTSPR